MESPFTHNCIATGNSFLSRKKDVSQIAARIGNGTHTVIYEPPKTGKQSAVRMALEQFRETETRLVETDLLSVIDGKDLHDALAPVAEARSTDSSRTIVYIRNFQNILRFADWDRHVSALGREMQREDAPVLIITGSGVNAMEYIFQERKSLYRQYERVRLSPIDEKSVTEHIIKTFLRVGRVVDQRQAEYIYSIADGHPWYIWQIANSCFNLTKGYLSNSLLEEAVESLLYTHSVRFQSIVDSLSHYQLHFLRAVFDGISQASSAEVVSRYGLNSSANVHRIKEAMMRKEVIVIKDQDTPELIDPIFRLWLERYYFKTEKKFRL